MSEKREIRPGVYQTSFTAAEVERYTRDGVFYPPVVPLSTPEPELELDRPVAGKI